jgi:hypothetical protein
MSVSRVIAAAVLATSCAAAPMVVAQPRAEAATATISVTFGDWRCSSVGGGSVVAVQMGSEYGSVPRSSGRTITIGARLNAANHLTGVVWCKPWWRPWSKPVYNIYQGVWPTYNGQHFNV